MNQLNKLRIKSEKSKITEDELSQVVLDNDNKFAEGIKQFGKVIMAYHFQPDVIKHYDISEESIQQGASNIEKSLKTLEKEKY